ncbi:hypothetical protein CesoFtcFv8_022412 [Champsocephalus esox]|uniref:LRRNT domain-containing protein n=1 Tax=Champsocephalus esox TaxID=159716 RepID=A0AAN8BAT4_9TELE|nr:hypothetical protein CesoFtcFv8_022412 [Champsocephalus esox]
MRCVSWLLFGTSILVLGLAVQGAPGQCPNLCHCHGDLQHVICDGVGLKKIPRVSEVTRLLNLQRNSLGSIPTGAFTDSRGLISLHMQQCQLREIGSQAFKGLKKLIYLYLSNNQISGLKPGAFDDLAELTYLYLDGNQISDLAKGVFSPMINLFILQLDDNRLRELRPGTFTGGQKPALAAHERKRADHAAARLSGRGGESGYIPPGEEQAVHLSHRGDEQTARGGGTDAGEEPHEDHPRHRLPELWALHGEATPGQHGAGEGQSVGYWVFTRL